jgi:hypothetical protein
MIRFTETLKMSLPGALFEDSGQRIAATPSWSAKADHPRVFAFGGVAKVRCIKSEFPGCRPTRGPFNDRGKHLLQPQ